MQENDVYITSEGIVEIVVVGDQTVESITYMGDRALALCHDCRANRRPVLMLDNILKIGSVPPEGRKRVVELIKASDYDKFAMVGSGAVLRLGANLMLQATGKGQLVRYFDDRDKAVRWLTSA